MPTPAKRSILLLEDSAETRAVLSRHLTKAGYEVLTANSGKEALELAASRHVDLVLSDHLMPGMHGTELAQQLKAEHPKLPVILISGVNELPAGSAIANAFVSKSEGPDALCKEVAAILDLPLETCEN